MIDPVVNLIKVFFEPFVFSRRFKIQFVSQLSDLILKLTYLVFFREAINRFINIFKLSSGQKTIHSFVESLLCHGRMGIQSVLQLGTKLFNAL